MLKIKEQIETINEWKKGEKIKDFTYFQVTDGSNKVHEKTYNNNKIPLSLPTE